MAEQSETKLDFQEQIQNMRNAFLAENSELAYRIKAELELEIERGLIYGREINPKLRRLFNIEQAWTEDCEPIWYVSMNPTKEEGIFLENRDKQRRAYEAIYQKALDMVNGVVEFDSCDFEKCLESLTTEDCDKLLEALDAQQTKPQTEAKGKAETKKQVKPLQQTFWQKLIILFKTLIGK